MRAARLLQIMLLLQNRGRQTSVQLAEELEVAPRTILRDVDAMTEAGLPIIVHQGNRGGIELGFNYRTRLTGLARDEAEALALILSAPNPMVTAFGLEQSASRARAKLIESLPDTPRTTVKETLARFQIVAGPEEEDPRIEALFQAVQARTKVRLRFASPSEQLIHPSGMRLQDGAWAVQDSLEGAWVPMGAWGRVNISALAY
ncbi:MAG: HTH domain-containing protein [Pseudomonadota bacterium]